MRILVVDDERLLVKGIKFNLENEGYQVECAYDGAAAVELAREGQFDLIILDLMMPEIDGLEACMRIREFSNVPVIMLTLDTEQRVAIRDGQVVELTAKEYDLIELLMKNPRRVYSRENLMNVVWGYSYTGDYRTVDVHIRRLREKLERQPAEPEYIMTKWGVGYYFKG